MCNNEFAVNPNCLFSHIDVLTGKKHNDVICPNCNSTVVYDTGVYI